jgi:AcrR family transcriptional regulator
MGVRAEQVEATRDRILSSAAESFTTRFFDDVSLDEVATAARTTVQTVIRHFGSKDALFRAAADWMSDRMVAPREGAGPGDVDTAIKGLVEHYEQWGGAVLLVLAQEEHVPAIRPVTDEGRAYHRAWVGQHFANLLDGRRGAARARLQAQLAAVTDVYTWKLLRRDSGLSRSQTEIAIRELVEALGHGDR